MKQIYTTTLRLNLADEDDRRAYEHLQRMDKKQYRSYSKAIVSAIIDHFERQARLESDPYLETREKEDAFLKRITEAIEQGLRFAPVGMIFRKSVIPNRQIISVTLLSNNQLFTTTGGFSMTTDEKKLLQTKHRLEEAEMRDRQKERKARTRRLIQEGAILEKVYPAAAGMDLTKLEDFLYWALR